MKLSIPFLWLTIASGAVFAAENKPAANDSDNKFHWSDLLPRGLQKDPRLNISVHTTLTEEGKKSPTASRDHPIYYVLLDGGMVEEGETVAKEKPPKPEKLAEILKGALATSGFVEATTRHPPAILVFYRWGAYNHITSTNIDPDDNEDMFDPTSPVQMEALSKRANLVGGAKFSQDLLMAVRSRTLPFFEANAQNDRLMQMSLGDLYFVVAVAFDGEAGKQNKKVALWTTEIATDSSGLMMGSALPVLVSTSREYFGHETKGPVLFNPRIYEGHVEIGEATVTGDSPSAPPPSTKSAPTSTEKR